MFAASLGTMMATPGRILWQCLIQVLPTGGQLWADFNADENSAIELQYMADMEIPVKLTVGDNTWTVDLSIMMQINDQTGKERPVRRIVVIDGSVTAEAAKMEAQG